ncbi:hypothetical protein EPN42_04675 [bacterium]|nr:MAG: hypothetical protein EPN42_04675 [bacterium]
MSATPNASDAPGAILTRNLYSSPSVAALVPALVRAQRRMGPIGTNSVNPDFDSQYADLASVLAVVRGALNEEGIFIAQPTSSRLEDGLFTVEVETLLIHESAEYIGSTLTLVSQSIAAQSVGSLETYGRRYALLALTGTAAQRDDDDGKRASQGSTLSPAGATSSAQAAAGGEAMRGILARINELPDQAKSELWGAFYEKVHRRHALATDLPLLQLLLARASKPAGEGRLEGEAVS